MNKNIQNKAKFMARYLKTGIVADFGSEDINWDESLHNNLEKEWGKKILRVDRYGEPHIRQDFNKFPYNFPDEDLDMIISSEVIEHLNNPLRFLKECKRILKDDGQILLTTPNAISLAEMASAVKRQQHHNKVYTEHLYNWHKGNMQCLVEQAGLSIKEFRYISFYWRKNVLFRFIAWIIPFMRPNLFLVLEKK